MKRHFSNRGEALAEVTAARCLASRKASIKASFVIQADRHIASSIGAPPREAAGAPKRKQRLFKKEEALVLSGCSKRLEGSEERSLAAYAQMRSIPDDEQSLLRKRAERLVENFRIVRLVTA